MASRWRTCLVVIARDEAATIGRLLDSVRPFVDDALVLDTGSTDDTVRLAQAAGARVAHFTWIDDFSAARNAALEALRATPPDFVGTIALQDHFDGGTARSRLSRVLPGAIRYTGRIHEQPAHSLPVRPLDVQVAHDGYLPERLHVKQGRNEQLLRAAIEDEPSNPYLWYQLGKDLSVYERFADAEVAFATAAARLADMSLTPTWWSDLATRRLFGLKSLKRHADGMVFAEAQLQVCAESPDFFFALGDLLLDWAADQPEQAEVLVPMIDDAWTRCLEIGERPDQPGAVAGRGSDLAACNLELLRSTFPRNPR